MQTGCVFVSSVGVTYMGIKDCTTERMGMDPL